MPSNSGTGVDHVDFEECPYCGHEQGEMELEMNDGECEVCGRLVNP